MPGYEEGILITCHMSNQPSAILAPGPIRQYYETCSHIHATAHGRMAEEDRL